MNYQFDFVFKNNNNPSSPILFLHGFSASYLSNTKFEQLIMDYDYYGLNLPGHGKTNYLSHKLNIHEIIEAVEIFIKQKQLKNIILMGHSMGAMIASILVFNHPEWFQKVFYIAPFHLKYFSNQKNDARQLFFPKTLDQYKLLIRKLYFKSSEMLTNPTYLKGLIKTLKTIATNKEMLDLSKTLLDNKLLIQQEQLFNNHLIPGFVILGKYDGLIDCLWMEQYFKNKTNIKTYVIDQTSHLPMAEDIQTFLKIFNEAITN